MTRRRGALLVLLFVLVGAWLFLRSGGPVGREVAYDLGPDHLDVTELRVWLRDGDRLVREDTWRFDLGEAPRRVQDEILVPPVPLALSARVVRGGRAETHTRTWDASVAGETVVHLGRP